MEEEKEKKINPKESTQSKPMNKKKTVSLILTVILFTALIVVVIFHISDFGKTWEL